MRVRGRGSLRLNLMIWLVAPVVVILLVSAWLSYGSALRQATLVTDRQLVASARIIAEQIEYKDGSISVVIPPSSLELFASDSHDEVAYAVVDPSGALIAGFPGLNGPAEQPSDFEHRSFETMFRTEAMRAVILRQPVVTPTDTRSISVIVGETQKARNELFRSLWARGFAEQATLVIAAALSIWIGINRELQPLLALRRAVLERPADRFEPFEAEFVQSEIRPLVKALNSHMQALAHQIERQKRFLESAAHQLRTPLAVMKTQVGYARRADEPMETSSTLRDIDANLTAMSRLTNQLLTLGRVEHDRVTIRTESIDLSGVAREVVAEAAPRALDAGIDLVFETDGECQVLATTMLTREMAINLIDNAIAHAGAGAVATVSVHREGNVAVLAVVDDGRGVGGEEHPRLFERFRRGHQAGVGGSGLGLSIVAEIAELLHGSVDLPPMSEGKGFAVLVRLPLATSIVEQPVASQAV